VTHVDVDGITATVSRLLVCTIFDTKLPEISGNISINKLGN
jgi:hypothetical protein